MLPHHRLTEDLFTNSRHSRIYLIMKLLAIIALLAPLSVAAPTAQDTASTDNAPLFAPTAAGPSSVRILGISLLGSGCPAGTADVQIDGIGIAHPLNCPWEYPLTRRCNSHQDAHGSHLLRVHHPDGARHQGLRLAQEL